MTGIWDAMKKHQAEQQQTAGADPKGDEAIEASEAAPQVPPTTPRPDENKDAPPQHPSAGPAGPTAEYHPAEADEQRYSPLLVAHYDRGSRITEEYRSLRTSLLASGGEEKLHTIITSAEAGEGKTLSSVNLGLILTERLDQNTIIVDCDLRKGKIARLLAAKPTPGMADLLRGSASLKDVIQPTAYANLFFIPAGQSPSQEVGELVSRAKMEQIATELRRKYDHLIVDTPPINMVSDAGIIAQAVGQALLVVRLNKTRRESVDKAIRLLAAASVEISGVLLTHQKYHIPNYLYRYS